MKNEEWWMMKVEWWKLKMKDDDFKLLRGFADWRTNGRTDICDCRVAFVTEKIGFRLFDFWIRISIFKLRIGLVLNCFDLQRWNEHFSILLLGKSCILNISAKILWVSILLKNNFWIFCLIHSPHIYLQYCLGWFMATQIPIVQWQMLVTVKNLFEQICIQEY